MSSPRPVDANSTSTLRSWLDIVTFRPLLHLHFHSAFVPDRYLLQHKVQITYDYPPFFAVEVFKQLQVCVLIFLLFAIVILLQRVRYRYLTVREIQTGLCVALRGGHLSMYVCMCLLL